jgi:hypothetical protein
MAKEGQTRSTKNYTENSRLSNTTPTTNGVKSGGATKE